VAGFSSLAVIAVLFAFIFKLLPDVEVTWGDVWVGALATAVLFTGGKFLIGLYLGNTTISSAYGAAGSLVIVLIWIYYSAQLVFIGAEFTAIWALRHGSLVRPKDTAQPKLPSHGERDAA
jgi:membrane protein